MESFSADMHLAWDHTVYMLPFKTLMKNHIDTTYVVNKRDFFFKPRNTNVLTTYFLHLDECFNTALSPYAALIHIILITNGTLFPLLIFHLFYDKAHRK